jgi:MarR family transcriptional regulator, temperature-dependent positive regulator of motility
MTTPLALEIFDQLHELAHRYRAQLHQRLEALYPDLTFNEMRVLMHTGRRPGVTHKDLIERSHTDKAQMTRTITTLEERGWLTRTPSANDKRVRCLHLSAAGLHLFQQEQQAQQRIAGALLQDWPLALQQELLGWLHKTTQE